MSDQIEIYLPKIDSTIVDKIDDYFRSKNANVNELINHKNFIIQRNNIDRFIEENFPNASSGDKLQLKKIQFNAFNQQVFTLIRKNDNQSYKLDLIVSKRNGEICDVNQISYKIDVHFDPLLFFQNVFKVFLFAFLGPLAMFFSPIFAGKSLNEDDIKDYLIYKLAQFAKKNIKGIKIV